MNKIGIHYGKWLSSYQWTYIATIRRHFPLTEFNIGSMMTRLFSCGRIKKLFYAIEPDRDDKMTHAHLLIETNATYNNNTIAKELGINPKSIRKFDEVKDAEAVSFYCTKNIKKDFCHYDFMNV